MQMINLNRESPYPLVEQIVNGIRQQIEERELRPGSRLPSIRAFASDHAVSRFTVVDAYDRLVAQGYLCSRRGAGFFATSNRHQKPGPGRPSINQRNEDLVWLIRRLLEAKGNTILAGGPWLPDAWFDDAGIRRALRSLAGGPGDCLIHYGDPHGYPALREQIAEVLLPDVGISTDSTQVLLTTGASQALDLIARRMLDQGDTVLVDDPGYYNLFANLRLGGIRLIGVPRGKDGPDPDALDSLAAEHRPKLFFTQSVLQNPTGSNMAPHVAYRVLQAATRYDFQVVEDDIFSDLESRNVPRLGALDQLERVIYVGSFSKTLSGSLRVGFIACNPALFDNLVDTKLVTGIASSLFNEKLVHRLLADGHYRKFIARIRERVAEARCNVIKAFDNLGIEVFDPPECGLFLWGRFTGVEDSLPVAERALQDGMLLAPGTVFRPNLQPSPWIRFNAPVCDDEGVLKRLKTLAA